MSGERNYEITYIGLPEVNLNIVRSFFGSDLVCGGLVDYSANVAG